ncbi:MAG: di-trans,poly-cis-decaprenylcistransferase [Gemmatimonadota bacterium]
MPKSASHSSSLHVAVIMDGNGRWASRQGLERSAGHAAGAEAVRRAVEAAPALGIGVLTLYAFSSDNWQRPPTEVSGLFSLFTQYLRDETTRCLSTGVRLSVIGRRDRFPLPLRAAILAAERATARGRRLELRIALDYSARDAILTAATAALAAGGRQSLTREGFARLLDARDVDLLIRTGGERRLSDFLLWECAYAELYFSEQMWPDFGPAHLAAALEDFGARERRFGRIPGAQPLPDDDAQDAAV